MNFCTVLEEKWASLNNLRDSLGNILKDSGFFFYLLAVPLLVLNTSRFVLRLHLIFFLKLAVFLQVQGGKEVSVSWGRPGQSTCVC